MLYEFSLIILINGKKSHRQIKKANSSTFCTILKFAVGFPFEAIALLLYKEYWVDEIL